MYFSQKRLRASIFVAGLLFSTQVFAQSETFYKYVDKNGTVVITQNLNDVPKDQRDRMEEVQFSNANDVEADGQGSFAGGPVGKDEGLALKAIVNEENIKAVGEETVRQGKAVLSSFFEDQKTVLIVYAVAGIAGFFIFSKLLKRFAGGFVSKIVMKLAVVIVIFSGVYLLYLSWLSKTVLNFDQPGDISEQNLADRITTPQEILQKTQDVVDQFNNSAEKREAILNNMDGG